MGRVIAQGEAWLPRIVKIARIDAHADFVQYRVVMNYDLSTKELMT